MFKIVPTYSLTISGTVDDFVSLYFATDPSRITEEQRPFVVALIQQLEEIQDAYSMAEDAASYYGKMEARRASEDAERRALRRVKRKGRKKS